MNSSPSSRRCLTVVLAAGEGTRMRSSRPKVLHAIGGRSLLAHVLATVGEAGGTSAVVIGPGRDDVAAAVRATAPDASVFVQAERRGTAHAVLAARAAIEPGCDDLLVVFADTPLVRPQTLTRLRMALADGNAVAVLGFRPADRSGYGRLITAGARLLAIREEKDAGEAEKAITLCNAGLMALRGDVALAILDRIGDDNAKHEFYLTDAVAVARKMGFEAVVLEAEEDEVRGVNTQGQLAEAEAVLQRRLRAAALDAGVTMVAPETVHLSADTRLAADVTIEPYVVFGPGVSIEAGATIRSFSHLEGAQVGAGAIVGPYARLRPGAQLAERVHVGNFVEVKASEIGVGSKANHLAYIGDSSIGAGANIGAGTITCNYDGIHKHKTDIGDGAFIGSNSSLVAPVKIGAGAYVGSGSVITTDVPADALAIGRGRQVVKEGFGARLRKGKSDAKKTPAP
ncbi:bifunctional UDP-N-acetylglucosamine diphosphorylase/glucosamine-1-phosphate N-acetyltransferase GlmU [Xanthobacteraceae bacterium Astr-EGSB]|uniref:bifunctional UDP-N-acetylglucosamine diphosphorylase/glucosamine-1-phosphate N-acetyltransferase GlmU n=1 Tax=Astrobacterium formosum TaxID=3069710 RepID=UPI0027B01744|nr:bifunctional UDP-N-acetylglucosamine diphosphorylase/glucosamine-1-phosphate N-acetyltransferase GlmU [Xanthobacteraceae bacterium Astr-EGSB]